MSDRKISVSIPSSGEEVNGAEDHRRDQLELSSADEKKSQDEEVSGTTSPADDSPQAFKMPLRSKLVFATLAVLALMVALDGTSISVALPIIASELGGTGIEAFWSGTSFLLCSTVFQPTFASLSDIFGRKPIILTTLTFFLVGTIVAGLSENFTHMLVGRSIQGVGGGGLIALTQIIVTDLVPLRLRGSFFGMLSAMWALGSVTGPILGGGFSQNVTWRWIFYINFPFIGFGVVFVIIFLKLNFVPTSLMAKLCRIDYTGTFLFVASSTSFLIPLTWGGVMYDWDSWRTLVPLLIGATGLASFVLYETYIATDPMIPPTLFHTRTAIATYTETTVHGLVLWCGLYYLPLYFETVKEYTPILTGVALFPFSFTVAPSAAIAGVVCTLTGHYRWAIWAGFAITTLGLGLMTLLTVTTSTAAWIFLMLPAGIGLGMLSPALNFAIQASAAPAHVAIAVAMFSFFRALGQAIGVAVGGVIFQNRMYNNLLGYPALAPLASEYSRDAAGLVQVVRAMSAAEDAAAGGEGEGLKKVWLQEAYSDSLKVVWGVCCALMGVAGLISLFTEKYDLNRGIDSVQTIRTEKKEKRKDVVNGKENGNGGSTV